MSAEEDLKALVPALTLTIDYSVRAMRLSSALLEIVVAKGLATREEIDAAMRSTAGVATQMTGALDALEKAAGVQQKKPS